MSIGRLGRSVSVVSAAYTPLGSVLETPEIKDFSERELFSMACIEAMQKGGIEAPDIDAFYVGISGPSYEAKMKSGAPFFADWIGMRNKATLFHDEGCGGAGYGMAQAVMAVASGTYDCVISGCVNINSSTPIKSGYPPHIRRVQDNDEMWAGIYTGVDSAYMNQGVGGLVAMESTMMLYCKKYGVSARQLQEAFANYLICKRREALLNPKFVLINETFEEEAARFGFDDPLDYLLSDRYNPLMGSFVRAKFLGAAVDGASAVIVCSTDKADKYTKKPIEVAGFSMNTSLEREWCETTLCTDRKSFDEAFMMAGITDPKNELDYVGAHDCTVTMAMTACETAGYIEPGEAWKYMLDRRVGFDGPKPISTSGGRTQGGHPRSPAFVIEVAEAVEQMRGESGLRQIPSLPKTSLIWGGGSGFAQVVCVLKTL